MKTSKKSPCHQRGPSATQRPAESPPIWRIRLLINAAYAARAGSAQMTLNDWREVEQEIKRRLDL